VGAQSYLQFAKSKWLVNSSDLLLLLAYIYTFYWLKNKTNSNLQVWQRFERVHLNNEDISCHTNYTNNKQLADYNASSVTDRSHKYYGHWQWILQKHWPRHANVQVTAWPSTAVSEECQLVPMSPTTILQHTHVCHAIDQNSAGWQVHMSATCCQHQYVSLMIVYALSTCWKHIYLTESAVLRDFCFVFMHHVEILLLTYTVSHKNMPLCFWL